MFAAQSFYSICLKINFKPTYSSIRLAESKAMKETKEQAYQELTYVHDSLLQLRQIAQNNRHPMLAYFIEMAWVEVSDVLRSQFGQPTKN